MMHTPCISCTTIFGIVVQVVQKFKQAMKINFTTQEALENVFDLSYAVT